MKYRCPNCSHQIYEPHTPAPVQCPECGNVAQWNKWKPLWKLRVPYLSPTGKSKWNDNREEFFTKYLALERPPRSPQTRAMSVGSSFDAFCKAEIHEMCYGKNHPDSAQFEFNTIFETQVEEHNRDFALEAGRICFQAYKDSGAWSGLLRLLGSGEPPRMEFTEMGAVDEHGGVYAPIEGGGSLDPVVILGKPDLQFITEGGIQLTLDWKVNGYCSANHTSPIAGYTNCRVGKGFADNQGAHKDCYLEVFKGLEINSNPNIEQNQKSWAVQLCAYGWITGIPVGGEMIVGIDQLVCNPPKNLRIATHRCRITPEFQAQTYREFQECWDIIHSDHIFRELSYEESNRRCEMLAQQAVAWEGDTPEDEWFRNMTGRKY